GVLVQDNVFDGQGLALNGVTHATVIGNTFENIGDSLTANGTQHRGLVIEDAWGTHGVSNVTVTDNTFQNITSPDGAIAFQRFTDGSPADTATVARLNDIDITDNAFAGPGLPQPDLFRCRSGAARELSRWPINHRHVGRRHHRRYQHRQHGDLR